VRRLFYGAELHSNGGAAASARAAGSLRVLDVTGWLNVDGDALLAVASANGGALRELRGGSPVSCVAARRRRRNASAYMHP